MTCLTYLSGPDLAETTIRMLFCLDRYWAACEDDGLYADFWWRCYERYRADIPQLCANVIAELPHPYVRTDAIAVA